MARLEVMWTKNAVGVQATAGVASGTTAIPVAANGLAARRVLIAVVTATEVALITPSQNTAVTATNGIPISRDLGYIVLNVIGFTHISHIRNGAADVLFNIIPLEE
jgi:hypothetical protein